MDEDLHRHAVETLEQADALLFGRVTYEMMEAAWRLSAHGRERCPIGWNPGWSPSPGRSTRRRSTSCRARWSGSTGTRSSCAGDLGRPSRQLKEEPGKGLFTGRRELPLALAELGLIDEYEFVVHPRVAGHGPTLFAGLSKPIDLKLVSRLEFGSGAVAMRYEPSR